MPLCSGNHPDYDRLQNTPKSFLGVYSNAGESKGTFPRSMFPHVLDSLRSICQSLKHCGFWKGHKENQHQRNGAIWQKWKFSCQELDSVLRGRHSVTHILGAFEKQDQDQCTLPSFSHFLIKFKQGHHLLQSHWLALSPAPLRKFRSTNITHLSFLFPKYVFSTLASLKKP